MTSRPFGPCDLCGSDHDVMTVELREPDHERWCIDCYRRRMAEPDCACTRAGLPAGYNTECEEHGVGT